MSDRLQAPFPWFGGKSRVADLVWSRFGDVPNYVEPFFGSGAVLLGRPHEPGTETANDLDGFVANFWRAVKRDPEAVAVHADNPVYENDLHARHSWLVNERHRLQARLEGDPDYYDAKVAGWWVWGICCWIGGGFCSGDGPWVVRDGQLVRAGGDGNGVKRELIHLAGQGVNRQRVHLGDAGRGVNRKRVHLGNAGRGVNRQLVHLGNAQGVNRKREELSAWFLALAERLKHVRVCCGDWTRVCGPTPTEHMGLTGVFLDPPYADTADRDDRIYRKDCLKLAHDVKDWAIANGANPMLRIALCGYEGEHEMPQDWTCIPWKANGGYASQSTLGDNLNAHRERIWFSPACLDPTLQPELML